MKPSEIRDKPSSELEKLGAQLKEEVFRLRFRLGSGQLKQTANVRNAKRDLARVLTELGARSLKAGKTEETRTTKGSKKGMVAS